MRYQAAFTSNENHPTDEDGNPAPAGWDAAGPWRVKSCTTGAEDDWVYILWERLLSKQQDPA